MNCKRLQESIANCVSCVHFLNEKVLGQQKAKVVVQIKRLSSWCDTCSGAYSKIRTTSGPRSAGWGGRDGGVVPFPRRFLPQGEGDRRQYSLLKAGDVVWEERAGDEELVATEDERLQQ